MEIQDPLPTPESLTVYICEKCATPLVRNYEGNSIIGAKNATFALKIVTNDELTDPEKFMAMFEFWDQRNKQARTICGACLASAVLSVPNVSASV